MRLRTLHFLLAFLFWEGITVISVVVYLWAYGMKPQFKIILAPIALEGVILIGACAAFMIPLGRMASVFFGLLVGAACPVVFGLHWRYGLTPEDQSLIFVTSIFVSIPGAIGGGIISTSLIVPKREMAVRVRRTQLSCRRARRLERAAGQDWAADFAACQRSGSL